MIKFNYRIMKKILIIVLVMSSFTSYAQNNQSAKAKLEAARIALITERLELTPEQAQAFWPVYNEYAEQRRNIQMEYRSKRQGLDLNQLTDEQQRAMLQGRMEEKQRQLDLENKYSERLMNVINARQLMALKRAEDDFRSMILQRIQQRQRAQLQQQMLLQQRERKLKQGNN
jgi:hypothetical protein